MISQDVIVRGRNIGKICKPDAPRYWVWSAYIKGKLSFRDHYAFIGTFGNKRKAIQAVKDWKLT